MKYYSGIFLFLILCVACKKETDPRFAISKEGVGLLTKTTSLSELDSLFTSDSIVKPVGTSENFEIFEKGGKPLLIISPNQDSIPGIANIRILDPRYTTPEGISVISTFKDVREKMNIRKVITSLNNVVILIRDSDLYFTISKEELPAELRFVNTDIDMIQIPDKAKIKYMMMGWN